jgi:hypothetical protein
MKIELSKPCPLPSDIVLKDYNGVSCNHCQKEVIDYRHMTDAEMLNYIKKNGIGVCGVWREDQLDRDLKHAIRGKSKLFYLPLLAALFARPVQSIAQFKPTMEQLPVQLCKQESYDRIKLDTLPNELHEERAVRFGTGNVSTIRVYTQIPLTPVYVLSPKHWLKSRYRRMAPIIKFGRWYIPYISKR